MAGVAAAQAVERHESANPIAESRQSWRMSLSTIQDGVGAGGKKACLGACPHTTYCDCILRRTTEFGYLQVRPGRSVNGRLSALRYIAISNKLLTSYQEG